ncbi:malectin domain-containing carbohydrate-binding protein [Pelagicoccus sp. SDUM812005]|uniref:golvesin C-terminal-like domain-containing protein n=1 Tax=Pelagicoccus sp. SDUM812005 TaxID=3041257 RepID=UPI00280CEDFA|nr:malectin domain-containing carbohydrate-binding protein [Pelagicoccus sp. SDUM812005]MDQ8180994.1 malectin domain-containing carbohydrate-binding protein [Pelagicoccus sp. SDUM812005]
MKRSFPTFLLKLLATLALLAIPARMYAVDYYVTPTGAGAQDGSDWSNASPQDQIETLLNSSAPGDRVLLGSGTYTVSPIDITTSGTSGSPKALEGVDTGGGLPLFQGTFDVNNNANYTFLEFPGAAHYWEIKNLRFKDQPFVIGMRRSGTTDTLRTNILFENLHFDTIEDAIRLYNTSEILVKDCTVIRHTKKAFRIGDYSSFVTFDSCFTDCNAGDLSFPTRAIPNGFAGDDTDGQPIIHDITFIDCVALNNGYNQSSSKYWNGDGFSTERGTYNVFYIRCKAYGNNDAGFDNKASYITYQDCVSADNSRGYRHWADNGQMFNCVASFNSKKGGSGSSYGLWVSGSGGELTVDFSTMHGNGHGVSIENGASVTVSDSILSTTSATAVFASSSVNLIDTATYRPGEGTDPQYVAADPAWQGVPLDSMDSQTYGLTKGYSSERVDETPNVAPTLSIASSSTGGVTPTTIDFTSTATDSDGTIISYLWDFGDGNVTNTPNPTHTYNVPGTYEAECTVTDNRGAKASQSINIVITFPTTPVVTRIESGGASSFTDSNGNEWVADHSSDNGGGMADRGAIEIAGTLDDRIYQTERWGVSDYSIILANGIYEVKLHFAETYHGITAAGQRVFTVSAEDSYPAGWIDIDVFDQAGGSQTALVKSGFVEVEDNILDLVFTASADNPMISGIEILPAASADLPPEPSANFYASNVQTDGFTVTWDPASDETGVDSYDVYLDGQYQGTTSVASYTFTGLSPYTSYFVSVRARDVNGNLSAPSDEAIVKTLDDGTVGAEIILDNDAQLGVTFVGSWPSSNSVSGHWGADYQHNENLEQGSKSVTYTPDLPAARLYDVFLRWTSSSSRASNVPVDIIHANGTDTVSVNQRNNNGEWVLLGTYNLAAGTANSVVLRTDNTNGHVIADAVRFLANDGPAPDTEAPTVPTNLQSSALAETSFNLSWDASSDNTAVTGYEVYLDGSLYSTVSATTETIGGLTAETSYSVTVVALDAAGNASAASSALSVTTLAETTGGGGSGTSSDGIVSFNVTNPGQEVASTDSLGAVAATNWNNSTVNNETFTDATDSEGVATTLDIRFANTAFFYPNSTPEYPAPLADDASMMRTQRATSNSSSTAVYAEEVPYDNYDVYVYWGGLRSADSTPQTMTVSFQLWDGSAWVTQETKYITDNDHAWDGTYNESTATASGDAVDGNEYVVFRARTDTDFKIVTTAGRRIGMSGFQIVSRDLTPPSVPANLQSSNVSESGFTLSWDASTDNVAVTAYDVYLDSVLFGSVTDTTIDITGLSPETTYGATVVARDEAENASAESDALIVTTAASSGGGSTSGDAISVNITTDNNVLAPSDVVGAVPVAYWSNSTVNNENLIDVLDSNGNATTADIKFTNTAYPYADETPDMPAPLDDDAKMMRSQRARSNVSSMAFEASEIPYSTYDLYVYWSGRKSGETVPITMDVNLQYHDGSTWVVQATKYIRDTDRKWDGTYNESLATTAAEAVDGEEYVVFRGLTESSIRVVGVSGRRTGLSGFQIVSQVSTNGSTETEEPQGSSPSITSASSASSAYGSPFSYSILASDTPTSYAATGLPAGLSIDPASGEISGTPSETGSFTIELTASNEYGSGIATLVLDVAAASQSINLDAISSKTYGDAPFEVSAAASSGLPVALAVVSGPAEIAGNTLTLTGAGNVTVEATQAGDANYLPAEAQQASFEVAQASQSISIHAISSKTYGDAPFEVNATASSGLPVAFAVVSGPAEISGNTVTLTGAGNVTVEATQAGDANYLPAEAQQASFEVAQATASLSLDGLWKVYDGAPAELALTTDPADLEATLLFDGSPVAPTYPGTYDVSVSIDDLNYQGEANASLSIVATALVRNAPTLNGGVIGSVQLVEASSFNLNGGTAVSGDLLLPGTPEIRVNGQPGFAGQIDAGGDIAPDDYRITLNGGASINHLVSRVNPPSLPAVDPAPATEGTRNVSLNHPEDEIGELATLRNLTLNSNAGSRALPAGTYGSLTANGSSSFVLGTLGATEPDVYNLEGITLNGNNTSIQIVGPVVLNLSGNVSLNSASIGDSAFPESLWLRFSDGDLTLNGAANLHGFVEAPLGKVTLNGSSTLQGCISSDELVINGNALLSWDAP